jgi:taurine transport system permease protein
MSRAYRGPAISALAVALVIGIWALIGHFAWVSALLLPPPGAVLSTATELAIDGYVHVPLWQHVLVSVARGTCCFAAAVVTGIPIGLAMGLFPTVRSALDPFVQFLRPLPKLALIPLVIVWLGIGEASKFVLIYLATVLTIIVAAAAAVGNVKEGRIRAALALGVSRYQLFRHVILPSTLPELFTGVRVGIGIGWTTLIAAEMIAARSGLGWMVLNASQYLRTDVVLVGIFLLGLTGYALDLILVALQRRMVPWMGKD